MATKDVAAASNGGVVVVSTSYDERHPPENIIDGNPRSFWATTGLYPQEFIIQLDNLYDVGVVKLNRHSSIVYLSSTSEGRRVHTLAPMHARTLLRQTLVR